MAKQYGYAGRILKVDLSAGKASTVPTESYAERFLGGRGIAAKIYWDEAPAGISAFDPDNRLLFVTGPLAGFTRIAGSRWQVCGKSPMTRPERFCYSNLGGSWGAQLKFAGFDAVSIQGKSEKPAYIFVHDNLAEIRDASALWGKSAAQAQQMLKSELGESAGVVACGPAGENMVSFASLLADEDSSGGMGFGAVIGSKNLKAIAVRGSGKMTAAHPEKLAQLQDHIYKLKEETSWNNPMLVSGPSMKKQACFGCIRGCRRETFVAGDGSKGKFLCGSAMFYQFWAQKYYGEWNEVPYHANRMCDAYGVDTDSLMVLLTWMVRCYKSGILTDDSTGLPLSRVGSMEFLETLLKKLSLRQGFGDVLARGVFHAAGSVGKGAGEQITDYISKAGQNSAYCPRMYLAHGLLYAMEQRQPIQQLHETSSAMRKWVDWANKVKGSYLSSDVFRKIAERFWGTEAAGDLSTYEGKALAAKRIQDRQYAKESLILCDFSWPITDVEFARDHVGDPSLESKLLSAVTGREVDEEGLYGIGERVFNLQRAILAREGHKGRESDKLPEWCYSIPLKTAAFNPECLAPGKEGEIISRRGAVVYREKFEQMKSEYYQIRGWDVASGLQTKAKIKQLGLEEIVPQLEQRGLVV